MPTCGVPPAGPSKLLLCGLAAHGGVTSQRLVYVWGGRVQRRRERQCMHYLAEPICSDAPFHAVGVVCLALFVVQVRHASRSGSRLVMQVATATAEQQVVKEGKCWDAEGWLVGQACPSTQARLPRKQNCGIWGVVKGTCSGTGTAGAAPGPPSHACGCHNA